MSRWGWLMLYNLRANVLDHLGPWMSISLHRVSWNFPKSKCLISLILGWVEFPLHLEFKLKHILKKVTQYSNTCTFIWPWSLITTLLSPHFWCSFEGDSCNGSLGKCTPMNEFIAHQWEKIFPRPYSKGHVSIFEECWETSWMPTCPVPMKAMRFFSWLKSNHMKRSEKPWNFEWILRIAGWKFQIVGRKFTQSWLVEFTFQVATANSNIPLETNIAFVKAGFVGRLGLPLWGRPGKAGAYCHRVSFREGIFGVKFSANKSHISIQSSPLLKPSGLEGLYPFVPFSRIQVTLKGRSLWACRLSARSFCLQYNTDEGLSMKEQSGNSLARKTSPSVW